jgi:capsid protein
MVQTPAGPPRHGHRIEHGVEVDKLGRHVAYWILQETGKWKRLPAYGEKSGRKLAWLVYGTEKRDHETRGTPMLALVLQSLAEIDRYRDSVQRKATINSMLAMFIQKDEERMGTRPLTSGAIRRSAGQAVGDDNVIRSFNAQGHIPGIVFDELNVGEKPMGFGNSGTDDKFGEFEEAIVQAMAWHLEVPPEIMRLAFSNNYSASQAAINEFKMYLNRVRTDFGETFCKPIYQEWLVAQALTSRVDAPEILQSWRDNAQYDIFGAWISSEWAGHIKPSTDILKQANGYTALLEQGWISNDLASKELTGTKFTKNIKKLRRENELKAEVNEILLSSQREAEHENALALQKVESNPTKDAAKPSGLSDALGALIENKAVEIHYG